MNKCAIFDLDGTLLNTIGTIAYHGNQTLRHFGLSEIPVERYKYLVGNGAVLLVERMLKETDKDGKMNFDEVYNYYIAEYDSDVKIYTEKYSGIEELLNFLKNSGYKLAVLSNKPNNAVQNTVKDYFGSTFDTVYGASENLPKKPDPTLLNRIAAELNCNKDESIYIGDTDCDMQTGKNGGIFTIGALWGFRTKEELEANNAGFIAENPLEIIEYLKKHQAD